MSGFFRRSTRRTSLIVLHDGLMAALSFVGALFLRLGGNPMDYSAELMVLGTVIFTAVSLGVFWVMGLHRTVWRYTSLPEIIQIMKAAGLTVLLFLLVLFLVTRLDEMPRSALGINWFVLVGLLAGPRMAYRLIQDRRQGGFLQPAGGGTDRVPVLLLGAGDEAEMFLRASATNSAARYRVVGIVGTKESRVGRYIRGTEVMGSLDDLEEVIDRLDRAGRKPHRLIVTDPSLSGAPMAALLKRADALGMDLARLPRLTDFRHGDESRAEPRPIDIADLLGRPQQVLDRAAMARLIDGKRVLITGAGGSIGSELTRQVLGLGPSRIALLDQSEYALYLAELEVAEAAPELDRDIYLADVRNRDDVTRIVSAFRPDLVFHAAALKHVPIVENHPRDGILTNAIGTRNVADACLAANVEAMVLISTDKAVNPSSVMGASKRAAESYCQSLNLALAEPGAARGDGSGRTRFITVRFGNVLGSTGSVVPLFQRQLARGGPLTVTHPEMTRYFMTVREAVELVLEATVLGTADQAEDLGGALFVLDMGEPVRIIDLARQMIALAGLRPEEDIPIEITGLRPGEKLAEELFHSGEATAPTRYPGVLIARPRTASLSEVAQHLAELEAAARNCDPAALAQALARAIPEYGPPESAAASPSSQPAQPARAAGS